MLKDMTQNGTLTLEEVVKNLQQFDFTDSSKDALIKALHALPGSESNLSRRRDLIINYINGYITGGFETSSKYKDLVDKTITFIKQLQREGKETDTYIEIEGLRLEKKALTISADHVKNNDDIVSIPLHDYGFSDNKIVTIRQRVLCNPKNGMFDVLQDEIKEKAKEGYRLMTKADIDKILSAIPGDLSKDNFQEPENYKLLALQIITGWPCADIILDPGFDSKVNRPYIVSLSNSGEKRRIFKSKDKDQLGILFFVKEV